MASTLYHWEAEQREGALDRPSEWTCRECSEVISTARGKMPATLLIQSRLPAVLFGSIGVSKAKQGLMTLQEERQATAVGGQGLFSIGNSYVFPDHVQSQESSPWVGPPQPSEKMV